MEDIERMSSLGQLANAIDHGHVVATTDERARVQERWAANQMHCLRVEQMLLVAIRRLNEAGVPRRLLKGVSVSHLDYPDPAWREFGDADVLVPEEQWDAAVEAIESDPMFRSQHGTVRHLFLDVKGATFFTPDGLMLDLHKRLCLGCLGAYRVDRLFRTGEEFVLEDQRATALSKPGWLVHALVHWFVSKLIRVTTLRDLRFQIPMQRRRSLRLYG